MDGPGQEPGPLGPRSIAPGTGANERNDLIESRVECVSITESKIDEQKLQVTFRNNCDRDIVNFLIRYLNASYFQRTYYLRQQQERTSSISVNGFGVEKGFRIEAVIFKDGTGAGMPEKIRSLKLLYEGSRKELEQIIQMIDLRLDSRPVDAKSIVNGLLKDLESLPDENADFKAIGLGGVLLTEGKLDYTQRFLQIQSKANGNTDVIIEQVRNIRSEIQSLLSTYPTPPQP